MCLDMDSIAKQYEPGFSDHGIGSSNLHQFSQTSLPSSSSSSLPGNALGTNEPSHSTAYFGVTDPSYSWFTIGENGIGNPQLSSDLSPPSGNSIPERVDAGRGFMDMTTTRTAAFSSDTDSFFPFRRSSYSAQPSSQLFPEAATSNNSEYGCPSSLYDRTRGYLTNHDDSSLFADQVRYSGMPYCLPDSQPVSEFGQDFGSYYGITGSHGSVYGIADSPAPDWTAFDCSTDWKVTGPSDQLSHSAFHDYSSYCYSANPNPSHISSWEHFSTGAFPTRNFAGSLTGSAAMESPGQPPSLGRLWSDSASATGQNVRYSGVYSSPLIRQSSDPRLDRSTSSARAFMPQLVPRHGPSTYSEAAKSQIPAAQNKLQKPSADNSVNLTQSEASHDEKSAMIGSQRSIPPIDSSRISIPDRGDQRARSADRIRVSCDPFSMYDLDPVDKPLKRHKTTTDHSPKSTQPVVDSDAASRQTADQKSSYGLDPIDDPTLPDKGAADKHERGSSSESSEEGLTKTCAGCEKFIKSEASSIHRKSENDQNGASPPAEKIFFDPRRIFATDRKKMPQTVPEPKSSNVENATADHRCQPAMGGSEIPTENDVRDFFDPKRIFSHGCKEEQEVGSESLSASAKTSEERSRNAATERLHAEKPIRSDAASAPSFAEKLGKYAQSSTTSTSSVFSSSSGIKPDRNEDGSSRIDSGIGRPRGPKMHSHAGSVRAGRLRREPRGSTASRTNASRSSASTRRNADRSQPAGDEIPNGDTSLFWERLLSAERRQCIEQTTKEVFSVVWNVLKLVIGIVAFELFTLAKWACQSAWQVIVPVVTWILVKLRLRRKVEERADWGGPAGGPAGWQRPKDHHLTENIALPSTGEEAMRRLFACKGKDPYSILGLKIDCTDEDVRKYYRRQAVLVHPDKNQEPGAEEAFKILNHAFELIGEPEKRRQYDLEMAKDHASDAAMKEFTDLLTKLHETMKETINTMACSFCGGKHRRYPVDVWVGAARFCDRCNVRHPAKEGDVWAESSMLGFRWHYFACMDGDVYDITEWASCQKEDFKHVKANSHFVLVHISSNFKHQHRNTAEADLEGLINSMFAAGSGSSDGFPGSQFFNPAAGTSRPPNSGNMPQPPPSSTAATGRKPRRKKRR